MRNCCPRRTLTLSGDCFLDNLPTPSVFFIICKDWWRRGRGGSVFRAKLEFWEGGLEPRERKVKYIKKRHGELHNTLTSNGFLLNTDILLSTYIGEQI